MFDFVRISPDVVDVHFSDYGPVIFRIGVEHRSIFADPKIEIAEKTKLLNKVLNSMRTIAKYGEWQVVINERGIYCLYWYNDLLKQEPAPAKAYQTLQDNPFLRDKIWCEAMVSFNRVFLCPDFYRLGSLKVPPNGDEGLRIKAPGTNWAESATFDSVPYAINRLPMGNFFGAPYSFCGGAFLDADYDAAIKTEEWQETAYALMRGISITLLHQVRRVDFSKDQETATIINYILEKVEEDHKHARALSSKQSREDLYKTLQKYDDNLCYLISLIWKNGETAPKFKISNIKVNNTNSDTLGSRFQFFSWRL